MATAIGTNVVNSIARRYIMPEIVDQVYNSNPLFFRLYNANKRIIRGGYQIEVPLMYKEFTVGGSYQGFDLLDVSPQDTVKNGAWDWKQYYVPVTVDGLTLIKTDSPEAIADFIRFYFKQASMQMAENLGDGVNGDGTGNGGKDLDGIALALDDSGTYGGLSKTANSWWQSGLDNSSTTTMTLSALQTAFGSLTVGGQHPSLITTTQANYNRYWNLNQSFQRFPEDSTGSDQQLARAGFTNLLFNNVPFLVDSHSTANYVNFLNEEFWYFAVSPRADFYLEDFQQAIAQDAMTAKMLWAGNLLCTACNLQGRYTAMSA
jgi:hypothetical protein